MYIEVRIHCMQIYITEAHVRTNGPSWNRPARPIHADVSSTMLLSSPVNACNVELYRGQYPLPKTFYMKPPAQSPLTCSRPRPTANTNANTHLTWINLPMRHCWSLLLLCCYWRHRQAQCKLKLTTSSMRLLPILPSPMGHPLTPPSLSNYHSSILLTEASHLSQ